MPKAAGRGKLGRILMEVRGARPRRLGGGEAPQQREREEARAGRARRSGRLNAPPEAEAGPGPRRPPRSAALTAPEEEPGPAGRPGRPLRSSGALARGQAEAEAEGGPGAPGPEQQPQRGRSPGPGAHEARGLGGAPRPRRRPDGHAPPGGAGSGSGSGAGPDLRGESEAAPARGGSGRGERGPEPEAAEAEAPGPEPQPPAPGRSGEAGAGKDSEEEEPSPEDGDGHVARQLLRLKDQIRQQLLEYKAVVEASKKSPTEEITDDNLLQSRIEDLERKMEGVKIELEMKTLALKRVQVAHALQKRVEKNNSESESIMAILKNILTLNCSILKAQQQTRDLEEKMLEIKKKRLMLKNTGRKKLLEIQTENKKRKDDLNLLKNSASITNMKKNLQKEIDTTTIIQNVFQHIVMAAKIDWAADPTLKAIILQLEKNFNYI